jgi:hypothetical protein
MPIEAQTVATLLIGHYEQNIWPVVGHHHSLGFFKKELTGS